MIVERMKKLRSENKLTQDQLAKLLNLSQQTIGHYEKGRAKPDIETLLKMADIFECSVDYLLGRSDYRNVIPTRAAHIEGDQPITEDILDELEEVLRKAREKYKK